MYDAGVSSVLFFANLLSTVTIKDLIVPDLVQIGNVSSVVLDCIYSLKDESDVVVRWYFNDDLKPVYEWKLHHDPVVRGILEGRLDLNRTEAGNPPDAHRTLHITNLGPDLSGEYSCEVESGGYQAKKTRTMLVYSPQEDLSLNWSFDQEHGEVEIRCIAHGVYPEPNVMLDRKNLKDSMITVDKQRSRSWRNGNLYDAESTASYLPQELHDSERFGCRLRLPQADYLAIKENTMVFRNSTHNVFELLKPRHGPDAAASLSPLGLTILLTIIAVLKL